MIQKIVSDYEYALTRIILACINELPFPLGIKKTISVLRGLKSTFVIEHNLNQLETFSVLSSFSREGISTIIDVLIQSDLLKIEFVSPFGNMPVLSITPEGTKYLHGEDNTRIIVLDTLIDKVIPEFNETEKQLFVKLKTLRQEIASEKDLPAYVICHDTTLRDICLKKPYNKQDLLTIKGVGEKFIENYGDKFLIQILESIKSD